MQDPMIVKAISTVCFESKSGCKDGFTSTSSIEVSLPVDASASQMKFPSLKVRPPRTAVPVCGAKKGSSESMSYDKWMLWCDFRWSAVSSITRPMPSLSTSYIYRRLTPKERKEKKRNKRKRRVSVRKKITLKRACGITVKALIPSFLIIRFSDESKSLKQYIYIFFKERETEKKKFKG